MCSFVFPRRPGPVMEVHHKEPYSSLTGETGTTHTQTSLTSGFTPLRLALAIPQRGAKAHPCPASVEGVYSLETVVVGTRSFAPCVAG